jgi:hypothetical protein
VAAGPDCRRRWSQRRHRCRGGGVGRRARLGVRAVGGILSCATDIGAMSGRANTWGPDNRAAARSGVMHGGPTAE